MKDKHGLHSAECAGPKKRSARRVAARAVINNVFYACREYSGPLKPRGTNEVIIYLPSRRRRRGAVRSDNHRYL